MLGNSARSLTRCSSRWSICTTSRMLAQRQHRIWTCAPSRIPRWCSAGHGRCVDYPPLLTFLHIAGTCFTEQPFNWCFVRSLHIFCLLLIVLRKYYTRYLHEIVDTVAKPATLLQTCRSEFRNNTLIQCRQNSKFG